MDFAYNRKVAAGVLAVCVLGSVFGLGGNYLRKERAKAVEVFEAGSDPTLPTRSSVDAYLEKCAAYARTMASEVQLRVNAEDADAARALELASTVGDGSDYDARYAQYTELSSTVESMYNTMFGAGLSDAETDDFKRAYRNYKSEVQKIGFDVYHTLAAEYNAETAGFPASIVSKLVGAGTLNPF